mgnify:CR=1 FL=1|tara:strand:+ start:752 stop:1378 length:627 start_codon:yes stop_codon:yes gene_type:complete
MNKNNIDNKIPIYKISSKKKMIEYYDNWTIKNKYNQDMVNWKYVAPKNTVNLFIKFAKNKKMKILDAGCGTGLVGVELIKKGFTNTIGVDFSKSMLKLIPKKIYKSIELIDLNKKLYFKNNSFDAVICVGTFTYGHVKANALDEFIRIIKKNGIICFTINEGIYFKYKFNKKIEEFSNKKIWRVLKLLKSSYIINKKVDSWLCIAKIL